ncbi:hypothetical protein pb186bvf_015562 [Paramecium bursaria]
MNSHSFNFKNQFDLFISEEKVDQISTKEINNRLNHDGYKANDNESRLILHNKLNDPNNLSNTIQIKQTHLFNHLRYIQAQKLKYLKIHGKFKGCLIQLGSIKMAKDLQLLTQFSFKL